MSHYSELREADYAEARDKERKRVAKLGDKLLQEIRDMSHAPGAPFYVKDSVQRLEASILLWMRSVGAIKTHHGD